MFQDITQSIEACAAHYGDQADAMREYLIEGQKRALALPNRGPLRFDQQGNIHPDILDAYSTYGFYVLEGVLSPEEINDLKHDLEEMRDNFPTEMGSTVDAKGRPALGGTAKVWYCNGRNHYQTSWWN